MDQAIRKTNRGLSPIWILPFVAFCIGTWLLFVSFRDAGIEIKIHFDTAEGITPGKTQVLYRGIPTGQVQDVFVDEDLKGVTLIVEMDKNARKALVDDTQFWIVRPEVAEGKVSGLGTILTGSYLSMRPGSSSRLSNNFRGSSESPPLSVTTPGLRIFLEAESLFSLQKGSNIYTKDVKIGQVVEYHLTDAGKVVLDAHIDPAFSHLINESTRFWNSSGISLDGDIRRGFNLQLKSLAAMIYGGISCGTPKYSPATVPVTEGHVFQLYKNHNDAEVGTTVFLQLSSGGGIIEGKTRVMYRGLKAGVVKKIEINHDDSYSVTAELQLDPRAEPILKKGTKFWVIRPLISLDGIHNLDTIISGCYITFEPGEGDFQDHFSAENGTIPKRAVSGGKSYKLESKQPASLEIGSPIFYNKIKVGETVDVSFSQDSNTIIFEVLVYEQYTHLIRSTTAFWNAGGFQAEARLSGVKVDFSSLKTVLTGGIAFENPAVKNEIQAEPAPEGTFFPLYQTYKDVVASVPEFKKQGLYLQLKAGRIRGLRPGSPVLFNNFKVGEIIDFSLDQVNTVMLVDILIHESYVSLVNSSSRFYNLSGLSVNIGLEGLELQTGSFESIAAGGIAFFTGEKNAQITEKDEFVLYENLTKARLADNIQILVRFTEPVEIKENTQIKYRGVAIGSLKNIRFGKGMSEVICDGYIQKDAAELFRETTRLRKLSVGDPW
jgi:paraquat-inducible protein B